jgi:hypothetical protein
MSCGIDTGSEGGGALQPPLRGRWRAGTGSRHERRGRMCSSGRTRRPDRSSGERLRHRHADRQRSQDGIGDEADPSAAEPVADRLHPRGRRRPRTGSSVGLREGRPSTGPSRHRPRGGRPAQRARSPRAAPPPTTTGRAETAAMPWLRWRAPRDAGAALRITSGCGTYREPPPRPQGRGSHDRLTCEAAAGIVPEADTVAPAGID